MAGAPLHTYKRKYFIYLLSLKEGISNRCRDCIITCSERIIEISSSRSRKDRLAYFERDLLFENDLLVEVPRRGRACGGRGRDVRDGFCAQAPPEDALSAREELCDPTENLVSRTPFRRRLMV